MIRKVAKKETNQIAGERETKATNLLTRKKARERGQEVEAQDTINANEVNDDIMFNQLKLMIIIKYKNILF
jgi:hypothetical protein